MEYTITLPDSPSAIACGSDGAFLNSSGILGNGSSVALPCSTGLLPCHNSQGAEDQSSTCPHRQTCYQTLSKWYVRHGRYQRPDVTGYDRLDIARRFHDPDRPWSEVIGMAREYDLSRTTIYDIAGRASAFFEPRLPGPVPCLKRLLPCGATLSQPATEAKTPSREEEERMRGRLILTSIFPGGVTMRPLEDILEEAPLEGRSDTTIWRIVNQAGAKAYQILTQVDYADVSLTIVMVDVDETFFDGRPILFAVEPISLNICGFHVPSDGDR